MFQIRVQQTPFVDGEEAKTEDEDTLLTEDGARFLTGNPQVCVSTGKLRFYRPNRPYLQWPTTSTTASPATLGLPAERNTLLCIVTVPSHMSPVELLEFLAGFRSDIQLVRILKDPERSNCMALLQFAAQDRADHFFLAHNGTYFNSIELERCKIVFVRSIEFDTSEPEPSPDSTEQKADSIEEEEEEAARLAGWKLMAPPPPPPGMTEIPTCAVCLDRLDASASGILTTLCNHTFHCDCLFRWEGSSCPVCRYSHGDIGSACEVCQTTEHLWICLICGHVGCGRYSGEHAKQHYQETMHTYSLELETQRVWDYAGDGFVHRLILNKQDGKFVEFPNPDATSGERSQLPPPTTAELEEGEHRKLEKLAHEYNFLLKSQLEEQRLFYERRLASVSDAAQQQTIAALEQDKKALKKANETLTAKASKLEEELTFVRELNKSLIENQKQWKERVRTLEDQKQRFEQETTTRIADLEGQVRDLMFYLDTQSRVAQSSYRDDIQGGTIQIEAGSAASTATNSSTASTQRRARRKR
ncbi:hypothetical protein Poli38472_000527 [Pythium oligandrum]|uniref:BRCA1-associated protein n=1 Tax=Pythium oligandrum TaxID=41045 RepID=A0A8K1CCW0_PYTOL|nr:hypothetical protein Poli38472_000527 [Pythium oligandrum]|eukprot:TMW60485.1 hypothetical protein Poli38472_000527 [Pythium oligandrum]